MFAQRPHSTALQTVLVVAIGVLTIAAVGCGGSAGGAGGTEANGIGDVTPQEALKMAKAAVAKAESATIHGTAKQHAAMLAEFDLRLTRDGGQGTINLLGISFEAIRIGEDLYVKGSPGFYARIGVKTTVPADMWIKPPANAGLGAFTELEGQTARILSTSGATTMGSTTTVDGQPALELKTEGKLYKGRVYLKTTGEPLPLKLEKRGRETATFTFTDWNRTPAPTAPTKTTNCERVRWPTSQRKSCAPG